jgi:2-oxoglutarate ferredoxin oxidoreductase subunit alpha
VFILSDQAIATRIEAFAEPDLKKICQDITPDLTPVADYKPYDLSAKNGLVKRVVPGTRIQSGKYPIATGLEHDEMGHPTGSPKLHAQMTARRRRKLQALAEEIGTPKIYGPPEGNVLLVGWGSTEGPIREAVDRARAAGDSVSGLNIRHLSPLPNGLENIFSGFNQVLVVEMNDEGLYGYGQLAAMLRARFCDPKIRAINKVDGLTFKVKDILERVKTALSK